MLEKEIIEEAKKLCEKFVNKVETGKARSKETYNDCLSLLKLIENYDYCCSNAYADVDGTQCEHFRAKKSCPSNYASKYTPENCPYIRNKLP